jgi:hypothetical protein
VNYFSYYLRNKHQIRQDVNFFSHPNAPGPPRDAENRRMMNRLNGFSLKNT